MLKLSGVVKSKFDCLLFKTPVSCAHFPSITYFKGVCFINVQTVTLFKLTLACVHDTVCYLSALRYILWCYYSGQEPLKGYDFMVNSVWPEVVELLETQATSVFAPGNPDRFYKVIFHWILLIIFSAFL